MDAGSDVASSGRSNTSNGRNNASKINKLTSKVKCAVCTLAIVDGKDHTLLCEGACGAWIHRYCVGASLAHFEHSSSTSKPYICGASKLLILWNFMPLKSLVKTLQKEVSQQYTFCFGRSKEEMYNKMPVDDFTDSHIRLSYTVGKRGRGLVRCRLVRCRRDRSNDSSRDNNTIGDSI